VQQLVAFFQNQPFLVKIFGSFRVMVKKPEIKRGFQVSFDDKGGSQQGAEGSWADNSNFHGGNARGKQKEKDHGFR
jgi:hypothetical protein